MASNTIPRNLTQLISLGHDAADGALAHGAAVGLKQNTAADIRTDLVALDGDSTAVPPIPGAQALLAAAKSAKTLAAAAARTTASNGRGQIARCVDGLKATFGRTWSSQWEQVGFTNHSLAIPDDPLPILNSIAAFLGSNPALENVPGKITKADCAAAAAAVTAARKASNDRVSELATAFGVRDAAKDALYARLSGLLAELGQRLEDDDPRWYHFGFDRPADGQQPGPVTNLILQPGGPGMVFADWDDARRADRYRVFKQIVGTEPAPVEVASTVADSEYTLTGLPPGATVKITITPANEAGDGPASEAVQIVVPS